MAYFIVSKARNVAGQQTLLATRGSRDAARQDAPGMLGTVKSELEFQNLKDQGMITEKNTVVVADLEGSYQVETQADAEAQVPAGEEHEQALDEATADIPEEAASHDPEPGLSITDPALAEQPEAQANAASWDAVTPKAEPTILEVAAEIMETPKVRKTQGKKAKPAPKRPATDEAMVQRAREYLAQMTQDPAAMPSKVNVVRALSTWNGNVLQRKDVLTLIAEKPELGISPATVSTQLQFARSGKLSQNGKKED